MADNRKVPAFSAQDMKRRKTRNLIMALGLVAFIVIVFVTTIFKIKAGIQ
ncbi:hypothetical protein [Aestuariivirga litoralis]|nr:hypothetical protein [Aestuariivirga litoralis]